MILRPFQKSAIDAFLKTALHESLHVLCIAATGSGKSLIFEQLAASNRYRMILISPLVALARQHHQNMIAKGIKTYLKAAEIKEEPSDLSPSVWIMSPEHLELKFMQKNLKQYRPDFLVVDECHCVWEWGNNFRPAFHQIILTLKSLDIKKSLWLTATFPPKARQDLKIQLGQQLLEMGHFSLPQKLQIRIIKKGWHLRTFALMECLNYTNGVMLIFVQTRSQAESLMRLLQKPIPQIVRYHAGLSQEERRATENLIKQKIPKVIIATSAFGMGMDYAHIRTIVLWQAPLSMLTLVQMIGRATRNVTAEAQAIVFWDHQDYYNLSFATNKNPQAKQDLDDLFEYLQSNDCRMSGLTQYFEKKSSKEKCFTCDNCKHLMQSQI